MVIGNAPYIGKNLIQHLVTSNPSPAYVTNVTNAFNSGSYTESATGTTCSGGTGRGDMQAVIAGMFGISALQNLKASPVHICCASAE